ncbi:MAG: hypothetical protein K6G07_01325 [Lachnospiraceae bacterium]|nr:hypothetical protein [Lachnospiraceae bacterium]
MDEREERFGKELKALVRLAKSQGNKLKDEQIKEAFEGLGIEEDKMPLVYSYLASNKIAVDDDFDPDAALEADDVKAIEIFREEVAALPEYSEEEKLRLIQKAMEDDKSAQQEVISVMLPKVLEIAKLYAGQGVPVEDLIGEGNVALCSGVHMAATLEKAEEAEGFFAGLIMDAMEVLVSEEVSLSDIDEKVLEQVNRVAEAAERLYEDLRRKVTPEELAAETDLTEEEIREAYRLSGDQIDTIEIPKDNG